MEKQHTKFIDNKNFEPKNEQGNLVCCNTKSIPCSFLSVNSSKELPKKKVEYLESFFRNIIRMEIEKYIKNNKH